MVDDDDWRPAPQSFWKEASRPAQTRDTKAKLNPPTASDLTLERRLVALNARLKLRGHPPIACPAPHAAIASRPNEAALERLTAFSKGDIADCQRMLGPIHTAAWPNLDGCLGVIFTSRSGSSYLARELALLRRIGRMEESLNPHLVEGLAAPDIVRSFADGWFSFKLGTPGIISAELCGVLSQYLEKTYFIFLLRRDIIGQAVSLVKASQTGRWHSIHSARAEPQYDSQKIADSIRNIAKGVASLRRYLTLTKRPWKSLFYEQFEHGDFSAAEAICEEYGIPPLAPGTGLTLARLERTADTESVKWIERFRNDIDHRTSDIVEQYLKDL